MSFSWGDWELWIVVTADGEVFVQLLEGTDLPFHLELRPRWILLECNWLEWWTPDGLSEWCDRLRDWWYK